MKLFGCVCSVCSLTINDIWHTADVAVGLAKEEIHVWDAHRISSALKEYALILGYL